MKKVTFFDIALLVLSLFLAFGTAFVFHACGPKADGSWMNCHQAESIVVWVGAVLSVLSIVRLFVPEGVKTGLSISFIPFSVFASFVPGVIIHLCMMHDMRCHAITRPAVLVISILIAVFAAVDVVLAVAKGSKKA